MRFEAGNECSKNGDFSGRSEIFLIASLAPEVIEEWPKSSKYEPIQCFQHSLSIYDQQAFPEFWATLQRNLGLAYRQRSQGDRRGNWEEAIECFLRSQEVYTEEDFPNQWIAIGHELLSTFDTHVDLSRKASIQNKNARQLAKKGKSTKNNV